MQSNAEDENGFEVRWYEVVLGTPQGPACWKCGTVCEAWLPDGIPLEQCMELFSSADVIFTKAFRLASRFFEFRSSSRDPCLGTGNAATLAFTAASN